ncbi:MAG: cytochrome c oxidase subunit 3 [Gemmatimonadota bacterium]|nr:cytochrome c oxidase subunit 3 [Gemmatimonadota bacterium]
MATAAIAHDDTHAAGGHPPTTTGLDHKKIAMWAFIGSECMLFASLISTYLIYKGRSLVGPYPHEAWVSPSGEHFNAILNIPVTSMSTFVLLMSSLFMVLAHSAVVRGDRKYSKLWLAMTALAGATFLGFQAFEFTSFVHEGLTIRSNLFGSTFFTLTGFHGAHVTAGVIWLVTLLFIDQKRGLRPDEAINVDLCALYWHFVDVVWIAIFTLIYLIK